MSHAGVNELKCISWDGAQHTKAANVANSYTSWLALKLLLNRCYHYRDNIDLNVVKYIGAIIIGIIEIIFRIKSLKLMK